MKKYLQACKTGGSIYGKSHKAGKENGFGAKETPGEENILSGYRKLYRNQLAIMNNFFRKEK